jgi:hypothetical protein
MTQRCKTNKLIRHCDQEINWKVMLYSNIGSKASQQKVCIFIDRIEKLASDFLSNAFEIFKLWRNSTWLSGVRALTPINHTLFKSIRRKRKNKITAITTQLESH